MGFGELPPSRFTPANTHPCIPFWRADVRHLRSLSVVFVLAGLVLLGASLMLGLNPTWTLAGLLLAWAGAVKVIVIYLWRGIAASGGVAATAGDED